MKSKHKNKTNFVPYYFLLVAIVVVLVGILGFKYNLFTQGNISEVTIKDECSLIMGNLIHEIGSESNCKLACETECIFAKKKMYNFSFESKNESCNSCLCNCKG